MKFGISFKRILRALRNECQQSQFGSDGSDSYGAPYRRDTRFIFSAAFSASFSATFSTSLSATFTATFSAFFSATFSALLVPLSVRLLVRVSV